MADPRQKQLTIKTGVVKRLTKEVGMYKLEVKQEEERLEKMQADKKDEYEINKQKQVLQESQMMIPDCTKRLKKGCDDLSNLLESESDLAETEEYKNAQKFLNDAKPLVAGL